MCGDVVCYVPMCARVYGCKLMYVGLRFASYPAVVDSDLFGIVSALPCVRIWSGNETSATSKVVYIRNVYFRYIYIYIRCVHCMIRMLCVLRMYRS